MKKDKQKKPEEYQMTIPLDILESDLKKIAPVEKKEMNEFGFLILKACELMSKLNATNRQFCFRQAVHDMVIGARLPTHITMGFLVDLILERREQAIAINFKKRENLERGYIG